MTNLATFTIQGTPSVDPATGDRIYRARTGEVVAVTLELNPAAGVSTVTYELWNKDDPSAPLASKSVREWWPTFLAFDESGQTTVTPSGVQDTVHITMPASPPGGGSPSWVLRCRALTDAGEHVFERGLSLNGFPDSVRETVPAERGEFHALGWEHPLNAMVQNSFPVRRRHASGVTIIVAQTQVANITPTVSRRVIASARVWAAEDGGGDSLWRLERQFQVDGAGMITASSNAISVTKSSGGTQVSDSDWVPSLVVDSGQVAVDLNQQQAGTFSYDVFLEVIEQPL